LKTGDVVRLADGCVTPLGRTDRQVKINGVRTNLEEIEQVICERTGMACFVGLVDSQIVAVLEGSEGATTVAELSETLDGVLPSPCKPRRLAFAERLPRNRSGKADVGLCIQLLEGDPT
jgi:acyl-coenzyme A synthetase/AMP-(fatty) acid ligase